MIWASSTRYNLPGIVCDNRTRLHNAYLIQMKKPGLRLGSTHYSSYLSKSIREGSVRPKNIWFVKPDTYNPSLSALT